MRLRACLLWRQITFTAISLLFAMTTLAQTPAPLGRLFLTPQQRLALDRQRNLAERANPETRDDHRFTVSGIVIRSSGRKTIWVNDKPMTDGTLDADLSINVPHNAPAQVLMQALPFTVATTRVGETFDRSNGTVSDLLGGGSITLGHPQKSGDARISSR